MPQESYLIEPKLTLVEFGIQLVITKHLQYCLEKLFMLFFSLGINENIVDEDHPELVREVNEHLVHHMHQK